MNRRVFQLGGLSAAGVALGGCWRQKFEFNQKLTLKVSTPEGEKTASSVTNVVTYLGPILLSGSKAENRIRGEATVLEVSAGKYLFALIGEETKTLALRAWSDSVPAQDTEGKMSVIVDKRESIVLPPKLYPMLVTFVDLKDPTSVVEVKPTELSKHFGPGVSLASIALEITDQAVTEGAVEKVLTWLGPYPEPGLCPATGESDASRIPFCRKVAQGDFIRGAK
jgi:hypothetical protein